ncbi:MAG: hypothetical protein PHV13_03215 [Candidatus ainarchaeum sp.]|nr:hypothetical protein [Candidatus ainarchaeum sp.]
MERKVHIVNRPDTKGTCMSRRPLGVGIIGAGESTAQELRRNAVRPVRGVLGSREPLAESRRTACWDL